MHSAMRRRRGAAPERGGHADPPRASDVAAARGPRGHCQPAGARAGRRPAATTLEVAQDEGVDLVLRARPAAGGETVRTSWTVDGVPAGEGETLRLAPTHLGRFRARALALGSLGSATAREWEIDVRPTVL